MRRRNYLYLLSLILLIEIAIAALIYFKLLEFDFKVGITAFTVIPLFIVTLSELARTLRQQRAAFVKDYVAKFYTEKELYGTFHDLVYTYSDTQFKEIQRIFHEQNPKGHIYSADEKPIFTWFEALQGTRPPGSRLYHPLLFQGSDEERRLDCLLGYFDVIGYYYVNGLLEISDVVGSLGYHLAVIADRDVVQEYLKIARTKWKDLPYEKEMNAAVPFVYLAHLLRAVKNHNAVNRKKINQLLLEPPA